MKDYKARLLKEVEEIERFDNEIKEKVNALKIDFKIEQLGASESDGKTVTAHKAKTIKKVAHIVQRFNEALDHLFDEE